LARKLIKVKYISLVNLILDKEVVKELIQEECNPTKIVQELQKIEQGQVGRLEMEANYEQLIQKLGGGGASKKAASKIVELING
jgi:lipid-A-disaccharide synthase